MHSGRICIPALTPRVTQRFLGLVFISLKSARAMLLLLAVAWNAATSELKAQEELSARLKRGGELYHLHCFACHQINGQGIPGVFPPLAASDFIARDLEKSIRSVLEGLTGEITVNGIRYAGAMPPSVATDPEVADIFTYILNSWGNAGGEVGAETVARIRSKTAFPTLEQLQKSSVYPPLPATPEGFTLREVVRLPFKGVRLASDGKGEALFILTEQGDVWRLETAHGSLTQVLWGNRYLEKRPGDLGGPLFVLGLTLDRQNRLHIGSNQQNNSTLPTQNIVTIYRTAPITGLTVPDPKPWFQTNYPGNAAYVHGLEHIAFGPDGFLYAGNGARTDAGQTGNSPQWYGGGETPITASLWRIDPNASPPTMEIFARGIRNAYGFCWNDQGEMLATENGPDADAPEELNLIEKGRHYGFPYKFADWTKKAYGHTPDPPAGLEFTPPIPNLGPDGGFAGQPIYSFDPHSGPGGIVFLGTDFPEGYRGSYLITRFGNFIRSPKDNVGFDVLQARLTKNAAGRYEARMRTLLAPLGRPIDIHLSGKGTVYICEYSRGTTSGESYAPSGRILELKVKSKPY